MLRSFRPILLALPVLLAGGGSWESVIWLVLRFIAIACVLMAVVSLVQPARWAEHLRRYGWWGPALAMSGALSRREAPKK